MSAPIGVRKAFVPPAGTPVHFYDQQRHRPGETRDIRYGFFAYEPEDATDDGWTRGVWLPASPDALREMRERIDFVLTEAFYPKARIEELESVADAILALIVPETHEGAA